MGMLSVESLVAGYGQGTVLRKVSLSVDPGQVACVLGPNGAGKTTLLRAIAGLLDVRHGTIRLRGEAIEGLPPHIRTRHRLAYVPEETSTFDVLTVLENLRLGAIPAGKGSDREWLAEHLDHVFDVFPRLKDRLSQRGGTLSGGEQKMLVIGRALMSDPEMLLLDEPSLGLAPKLVVQIFESLESIKRDRDITVLIAEQNADRALNWADSAYIMSDGRIQYFGTPERLLEDSELMGRLYLGESIEHA